MIIQRTYGEVEVGDAVRCPEWPTLHTVERVTMTPTGFVSIEIGVGALIEKLAPQWRLTPIEIERP